MFSSFGLSAIGAIEVNAQQTANNKGNEIGRDAQVDPSKLERRCVMQNPRKTAKTTGSPTRLGPSMQERLVCKRGRRYVW